ncbi:MAG: chemotaxis protein CheW [Bdellovibrionota bacterium]
MTTEFDEFKCEIFETLDRAETALLQFDQIAAGESSPSLYDEVFRAYHNIKGAAGMMEWAELQHHVHQLENVLMQSKANSSIPKHLISWFLRGNDVTRSIMNNEPFTFDYETSNATPAPVVVATMAKVELPEDFTAEVNDSLERISQMLINLESEGSDVDSIDSLYRDIHSVKGACQLFGLVEASALFHAMESSLEGIRKTRGAVDNAHVSTLLLCIDLMNICLKHPGEEETLKEVNFMVSLLTPFITLNQTEVEEQVVELKKPVALVHVSEQESKSSSNYHDNDKSDTSIRVQVSLLDRLMTLMGEMVLVRNQVLQYSNKTDDLEFLNLSQKLDVVTSELQEETMKTRMQPIGNVVSKFQRVVRDLAGTLNKKINLNLHGIETELDKTLIEAVKDPLTHIVRNSCDHGIETPEQRKASGKPDTGNITIKAYHEGGQVIVAISDDGKGLSRDKLLKKALEKGIIDQARADRMSDREVQGLIFAPGFSTAEKVTNVSGRGVGMDVVKSNIEKIGGLVDITSVEGAGTTITLKIPLTLAIVPAMIVRSEKDRFAIPQVKLVELVRVERSAIEMVQGRKIYRLRGNILPLIGMKEVLQTEEADSESTEALNIVVLNSEKFIFGLIVDEILDTADIVVKPLARFLKPISIYSGATVLGDGNVAFIMDVLGIAQKHFDSSEQMHDSQDLDKYADLSHQDELREFVLIKLGSQTKHALPLSFVSRMEEFKTNTIELSGHQRVVRYRGGILKILKLNDLLGYPSSEEKKDVTQVIVTKSGEQMLGLEVDQIIDVLSTRDLLADSMTENGYIQGNLVTNSEIIVVLDVEKIFTPASSPVKATDSFSSPRILLVEDTESIRNVIASHLRDEGWDVEIAVDGIDGLRKIAELRCGVDLIVSDIEMPRMNGYDFARKVRGINQLKDIPLIAFTTKNSPEDIREAKQAGFNTFLEKGKGKLLPLLVTECLNTRKRKLA